MTSHFYYTLFIFGFVGLSFSSVATAKGISKVHSHKKTTILTFTDDRSANEVRNRIAETKAFQNKSETKLQKKEAMQVTNTVHLNPSSSGCSNEIAMNLISGDGNLLLNSALVKDCLNEELSQIGVLPQGEYQISFQIGKKTLQYAISK